MKFDSLTISEPQALRFGSAPKPVSTRRGLVIGGGTVYPEVNFTLPPISVTQGNLEKIRNLYRQATSEVCRRAVELEVEGLVIEFETLLEMTSTPQIAVDITATMNEILEEYHTTHGLKSALRITPNDTRELTRPPLMRSGAHLDNMLATFEGCARAGAELLSIESTGGKEVHDDALVSCNIEQVLFALAVMGCRDMQFLWDKVCTIATTTNTIAAGDTACGFGNTAMVLAEKRFIPRTFAAVVRAMTAVRSLVAYEQGAVGPGKDCGYENVYLKAITGYPMSMEGKSAVCAHSSPVGNIAAATCDLWSNESVQIEKLLGGPTPVVFAEQLVYDCRLMNTASKRGEAHLLRDQMVDSDRNRDPQALILSPSSAIRIAKAIVKSPNHYTATRAAGLEALVIIDEATQSGKLQLPEMEQAWPAMLNMTLGELPEKCDDFVEKTSPMLDQTKFVSQEYNLTQLSQNQTVNASA